MDMVDESDDISSQRPAEHRPVDEYANLITHGLGFILSLVGSAVLMTMVIKTQQTINIVACSIYCCSLVGLYAASMLSHMFFDFAWRRFFRSLDQAFIYLLIAGSFTPVAVVFLRHQWWPVLILTMWVLAILGVLLVIKMRNLTPFAMLSFGVLGCMPMIALKTLIDSAPFEMIIWIVVGGICYSLGTLFLTFDWYARYFHAMWHTLVIAGSTCHYLAILLAVM